MSTAYRRDIDGLRAVAVLLVIGFHAFPNYVPGGFVGVDIFFVISGFLISGVIFNGLKKGNFSFCDFYARRIRRIFPALIVVLTACAIFGWYFLLPANYVLLGRSVAASAAFIYNFVLLQEQGYFDIASELKPLLHLWSLGVEEQFYLVWPVLMVFGWQRKFAAPIVIAKIIFLVSFGLNAVLTTTHEPAAFFLPITRFWELMLGSILAIAPFERFALLSAKGSNTVEEAASWIGLALLGLAIPVIDQARPFPGWWALVPTLGTTLLIFAGQNTWINRRLLSFPTLAYVGLISYPLYLWHWPILSFTRFLRVEGDPTTLMKVGCIVLAFILADLTYRFIEKPIRFGLTSRTSKTVLISATLAALAIMGVALNGSDGLPSRFPVETQNAIRDYSASALAAYRNGVCFLGSDVRFNKECDEIRHLGKKKIVVWGDSHAAQLVPGLQQSTQSHGFNLIQYTMSSCPPLFSFGTTARQKICNEVFSTVAEKIALLRPETVIMAGFWHAYYGPPDGGLVDQSIRLTVSRLKSMGVQHIIGVGEFPVWKAPPQAILSRIFNPLPRILRPEREGKSLIIWNAFDEDRRLKDAFLEAGATFVSPKSTLCDENECRLLVPGADGTPMDWDTNHLTIPGSIFFVMSNEHALLGD